MRKLEAYDFGAKQLEKPSKRGNLQVLTTETKGWAKTKTHLGRKPLLLSTKEMKLSTNPEVYKNIASPLVLDVNFSSFFRHSLY